MTAPGTDQQPPQVVNSLMWQIGHGVGSGGQKMGVLALTQGALTVNLQVSIEDLERLLPGPRDPDVSCHVFAAAYPEPEVTKTP